MDGLSKGLVSNLDDFYYLARAILVKSETYYDQYDIAFQEYFKGIEAPAEISEKILEWLRDPINRMTLTDEEKAPNLILAAITSGLSHVRTNRPCRDFTPKAV